MRSDLLEIFVKYLLPPLATLVASGLAWVLAQGGRLLQTRAEASKTSLALVQLAYLAELVVSDIEAHEREAIKAASADGKISKEEGQKLLIIARERILSLAKERGFDEARKLLDAMAPSVTPFLTGLVERAVAGLNAPAVPKTVMNVYGDPISPSAASVVVNP